MPSLSRHRAAPLYVIGGIASVQLGGAVAKHLFDRIGPTGTVTLRLVFSAAVMLIIARPRFPHRLPRATLAALAGYALTLAGMNWSFYEALDRLPLGVAVTFEFTGPLAVALAGSRRAVDVLWAVLAGGGVVLLEAGGGGMNATGITFALVAGAFWAAYILLSARVGAVTQGLSGLALALTAAAVVVVPFGIAGAGAALVAPITLAGGFAVAMLASALPYSLEMVALRSIPTAVFGVLMSLEPAAAALVGLVVLREGLGARELVAIGLVTVASAGATWSHGRIA